MKKTLITIALILFPAFAYAVIPLQSSQIGTNPTNGYVIQTNGATSTWVSTSSLGISGGGGSGTVTSITFSSPLTGGTITNSGTVTCPTTSGSQSGCLSSTDWTTFNGKISGNQTITLSGDVSGSGATAITTAIGAGKITTAMLSSLISLPLASTTGILNVPNGGTGAATFGQGWLFSSGGTSALSASTSPTVNYIVATSTTASQFINASTTNVSAANICLTGDICRTTWPSGGSLSGGSPNTLTYWINGTTVGATSSPTIGYLTATSTSATSTIAGYLVISSSTPSATIFNGPFNHFGNLTSSCENCGSSGGNLLTIGNFGGGATGINTFSARGTTTAPTATQLGDNLYFMGGRGFGSTVWNVGSKVAINMVAAQAFTDTANGTYLTLETTPLNSTTRAEAVRVDSTGNVGIGTTSPYAKLSVNGQTVAAYFTATTTSVNTFPNASTTLLTSTGNTYLASAGGNVGINTTAPLFPLDVNLGNSNAVRYQSGSGQLNGFVVTAFGNYLNCANAYFGSGGWTREQSGPAACFQAEGSTGNLDFTSDGSGSAGAFSPTTVFTYKNATGDFGFGTTTPYATLSVVSGSGTGVLAAFSTTTGKDIDGYDNDGHTFTAGPPPIISTCGTGTGTVVGDDQSGTITTATAATACTATFAKAYFKTPVCTVTDNSLVGFADISSVSTSAVTFGISSALTGGLLFYQCEYHRLP